MIITGESKVRLITLLKKAYKEKNDLAYIITLLKIVQVLSETNILRIFSQS